MTQAARSGSKTKSIQPSQPARPNAVKAMTASGVKQHKAAIDAPTVLHAQNVLVFITHPLLFTGAAATPSLARDANDTARSRYGLNITWINSS